MNRNATIRKHIQPVQSGSAVTTIEGGESRCRPSTGVGFSLHDCTVDHTYRGSPGYG